MPAEAVTVPSADLSTVAAKLDQHLAARPALADRLAAIRAAVPGRIVFSTSLGREDQAILHAIWQNRESLGRDAFDILTLDTGRLFPETLDLIAESEGHFGLAIRMVVPERATVEALTARDGAYGFRNSIEARKACCDIRKVQPLARALDGATGWITGLRRGQSQARAQVPFAEFDAEHGLIKLNPLADWSYEQLTNFVVSERIPLNALHARGFPSIGCFTCTRAVAPHEDERAGRWWWESEDKKECGLHVRRQQTSEART